MNIDYVSIGKSIKNFRTKKSWTQATLAEKSGVEPSNISHIERGATKVSLPTLVNIVNALEVSLDQIVYDSLIKNEHVLINTLNELVSDCTPAEISAITEIVKTTKAILRKSKN
ncbi:MAG: helix-turn-helix transcriptional regulator [Oscillospiraceae bacterium]|nr:helix-turn-helix transcriptional regulator [Oscillospiraceae bacterium]